MSDENSVTENEIDWKIGDQIQVSQTVMTDQYGYSHDSHQDYNPQITALDNGTQVVVWESTRDIFDDDGNVTGSETNIYARVYDADGNPVGDEITLGEVGETPWGSDSSYESMPSVTATADGGFAIAWSASKTEYDEAGSHTGSSSDIFVQTFDATGEAKGDAVQVSQTVPVEQYGYSSDAHQDYDPKITALSSGGHVVVWSGYHQNVDEDGTVDSAVSNIYAQTYDADGNAIGDMIELGEVGETPWGSDSAWDGGAQVTSLDDGGFAITWQTYENTYGDDGSYEGSASDIYVQAFHADASPKGDTHKVSETVMKENYGYQQDAQGDYAPEIVSLSDGGYVVVWQGSYYAEGEDGESSVLAQVFDADGNAKGDQINLGEVLASPWGGDAAYDGSPSITALANGGFAIAWSSNKTEYDDTGVYQGTSSDIFVQAFDNDGQTAGEMIQASQTHMENGYDTNSDDMPEIAALEDGGFAVVWQGHHTSVDENGQSVNESNIYARAFSAEGEAVTEEISMGEVATSQYGDDSAYDGNPQITTLVGGGFTVAWQTYKTEYGENGEYLGHSSDIQMQTITPPPVPEPVFELTGFDTGEQVQASMTVFGDGTTDQHYDQDPEIVTLSDGGYAVVWSGNHYDTQDDGSRTSEQNIYARTFDADGNEASEVISIGKVSLSQWGSDYAGDWKPSVAATNDGGFIVSWESQEAITGEAGYPIGNTQDIMTQAFNGDGSARGEISQVSTTNLYDNGYSQRDMFEDSSPQITTLADGSYVVVWHGRHSELDENGHSTHFELSAFAQMFSADGQPIGEQISMGNPNESPWGNDLHYDTEAKVTALTNGGFAVTWQSAGSAYDGDQALGYAKDVFVQSFDANGDPATDIAQVSQTIVPEGTYGDQNTDIAPEIVALESGGYVVTWSGTHSASAENGSTVSSTDVYAKVYDADGNAVSGELVMGTQGGQYGYDTHQDSQPQVTALSGSGFAVTWQTVRHDYDPELATTISSSDVMVQVFDDNGVAMGEPNQVSQTKLDDSWGTLNDDNGDWAPEITGLVDGGYVVVWQGSHTERDADGNSSTESNIYARAFDKDGNAMTEELSLGTVDMSQWGYDQAYEVKPSVTALPNGGFAIAWQGNTAGYDPETYAYSSTSDIFVQQFNGTYEEVAAPAPEPELEPEPQPELDPEPELVPEPVESEGLNVFSLKMSDQASETKMHDDYGYQTDDHQDDAGSVHALAGGGYVVVWTGRHVERDDTGAQESVENNVYMKVYGTDGAPVSEVVSVGNVSISPWGEDGAYDTAPNVVAHADGSFSVVWSSNETTYTDDGMYVDTANAINMQTFDAVGVATSDIMQVSETETMTSGGYGLYDNGPKAASLDDGSTVVVWQDMKTVMLDANGAETENPAEAVSSSSENNIYAKVISADGSESDVMSIGEVAQSTWGYDQVYDANPKVTVLSDGGFAISWDVSESMYDDSGTYLGSRSDINVQMFNTDGSAKADPVQVSQTNLVEQWGYLSDANSDWGSEITALQDGGFVVAWGGQKIVTDANGDTTTEVNVILRTVDASGNMLGEEVSLGESISSPWGYDAVQDFMPKVTALQAGGFAVAWQVYRSDYDDMGSYLGNSSDVMMQIFDADGVASGEPIQVTETVMVEQWGSQTDAHQDSQPVITELADGSLAVAWQGYHTNPDSVDGYSATYEADVFIKVFDADGEALTAELSLSESEGTPYGSDASYDSIPSITALEGGGFSVAWQTWQEHYDSSGNWQGYSSDISVAEVSVGDHSTDSNDYVIGTSGDDVIIGGAEDDMLVGGEGADTFVIREGDGFDWIRDFEAGEGAGDVVDLSALGFTSFAELMENAQECAEGVCIELGEEQGVMLEQVKLEDIHEDDFLI